MSLKRIWRFLAVAVLCVAVQGAAAKTGQLRGDGHFSVEQPSPALVRDNASSADGPSNGASRSAEPAPEAIPPSTLKGGGPSVPDFLHLALYQRIVVLSDLHVSRHNWAAEEAILQDVNSWKDVGLVAVTGDVCRRFGTAAELSLARQLLATLKKPLAVVAGNHDYIYSDWPDSAGNKVKASEQERAAKLGRFSAALAPGGLYYARRMGRYLLVFLSTDDLTSRHLTQISKAQLSWFRGILAGNKKSPTIVFFHGPLLGTLANYNSEVNTGGFVAQPADEIKDIILNNKQIVLWVSGHTHTSAANPSFNSKINLYQGQVTDIHNSALGGGAEWTNSIFLTEKMVVVATYDHKMGRWLRGLRYFLVP